MEAEKIPTEKENDFEKVSPDKVLEFENLSEQQAEELKERIKENDGLIRIFMHSLRVPGGYEEKIYLPLLRILNSENTPPVFFFEDTRDFENMKKLLPDFQKRQLKKPVYLIETLERLPYPIIKDEPLPESTKEKKITDEQFDYGGKSTIRFLFQLHNLGVKKILIGGNNLVINEEREGKIDECVANFIDIVKILSESEEPDIPKIDIKVSMITAPNNRNDLKEIRPDLVKNNK
ncbi:MAG: hypothetical protein WCF92_03160 [bacterium]